MEKSILFDNRKFTIGTSGRYYFGTVKGKSKSLHRYKYEKIHGPIPKGWHIHHKDGNCFNNDIDNLLAIEPKAHIKCHPLTKEHIQAWNKAGIQAAPIWHGSKEGIEWHNQHYENIKDRLYAKIKRPCANCGIEVETTRKNSNCYCSNNCKSSWRRKNKPDYIITNCKVCNKEFKTLKFNGAEYCSKECRPAPNPLGYQARFL